MLEPDAVRRDRPAGLGLPPMVDHRPLQMKLRPFDGRRIGALAGEEERAELREIVLGDELAVGIVALDGAEGGGRREHGVDAVLGDHAPIDAGVGRADGLALEQEAGAAEEQRRIDDVGMADDPADIGGGEERIARLHAVDVRHRPVERHGVPAIVAHDALGLPGRAGGVEDVERIGRLDRHAGRRRRRRDRLAPVAVAPFDEAGRRASGAAG